jgi:hypothetical protein
MTISAEEIALSVYWILIIMKTVTLSVDCTVFSAAMLFEKCS